MINIFKRNNRISVYLAPKIVDTVTLLCGVGLE